MRKPILPAADGFSLLEVILALAILTGAIAILGEAARQARRHAEAARDLSRAQLLCESKLAEITAGLATPEPVQGATLETDGSPDEPRWLYSIATEPIDQEGLVAVRVTVARDQPPEQRPVEFSLVRWIADPNAQQVQSPTANEPPSGQGGSGE